MIKKILIIEDEPSLQMALVDKFTHEGFTTIGAKDGQEGLNLALAQHPDLILLDIVMPIMDGITMLSELRKDAWGKNVPVILLSNLSEVEKIAESLRHGVTDYLIKSNWKLEDITHKVKERLRIIT